MRETASDDGDRIGGARRAGRSVQAKAAGGVRNLDAQIDVMNLGVTRVGATATKTIIDDFRARKAGAAPVAAGSGTAKAGATEVGY